MKTDHRGLRRHEAILLLQAVRGPGSRARQRRGRRRRPLGWTWGSSLRATGQWCRTAGGRRGQGLPVRGESVAALSLSVALSTGGKTCIHQQGTGGRLERHGGLEVVEIVVSIELPSSPSGSAQLSYGAAVGVKEESTHLPRFAM